jgi:hypothetical protein
VHLAPDARDCARRGVGSRSSRRAPSHRPAPATRAIVLPLGVGAARRDDECGGDHGPGKGRRVLPQPPTGRLIGSAHRRVGRRSAGGPCAPRVNRLPHDGRCGASARSPRGGDASSGIHDIERVRAPARKARSPRTVRGAGFTAVTLGEARRDPSARDRLSRLPASACGRLEGRATRALGMIRQDDDVGVRAQRPPGARGRRSTRARRPRRRSRRRLPAAARPFDAQKHVVPESMELVVGAPAPRARSATGSRGSRAAAWAKAPDARAPSSFATSRAARAAPADSAPRVLPCGGPQTGPKGHGSRECFLSAGPARRHEDGPPGATARVPSSTRSR